jgi:RNA polymerase sigma-70 factor (ECF subfamily)
LDVDTHAFDDFFTNHYRELFGQAYLLTGNIEDAQDILQETFAQAWRHWGQVSSYDHPEAWARRVLHNFAVSRWRRAVLRHLHERRFIIVPVSPPNEDHLEMLRWLRLLSGKQRRAVVLHDLVGLTAEEIASEMGAAPSTVRTWLYRAHARLAKEVHLDD